MYSPTIEHKLFWPRNRRQIQSKSEPHQNPEELAVAVNDGMGF